MDLSRASLKLTVARVVSTVVQFLGIVYFTRVLGASEIGIFFLFVSIIEIISIPVDLGLRGAVEKRISEGEFLGEYLFAIIILKSSIIAVVIPLLYLGRDLINSYIGAPITSYLIIAIVLQETMRLSTSVLRGELRVGETAVLTCAQKILWVFFAILLINVGYQAKGLIVGLLLSFIFVASWGWWKSSVTPSKPSLEHFRSLYDYGKFSSISSIGDIFYNWMDLAIIGLFLTQTHVGAYEISWRISQIVMILGGSVATTILPQISRWGAIGDFDQIQTTVRNAIVPSMFPVIPAIFGVLLYSESILSIIFTPEFGIASLALVILMSEKLLFSVHIIFKQVLMGVDRPDLAAYSTVLSAAVNISLNFILVPRYGISGAAVATALSFALHTLLHTYYLSGIIDIQFPFNEIGWCWVSGLSMAAVLFLFKQHIPVTSLTVLLIHIIIGALIYGLVSLMYAPLRRKVVAQARQVI